MAGLHPTVEVASSAPNLHSSPRRKSSPVEQEQSATESTGPLSSFPALAHYHPISNPSQPNPLAERTDSVAGLSAAWGLPDSHPNRPTSESGTSDRNNTTSSHLEPSFWDMLSESEAVPSNSTVPTSVSLPADPVVKKTRGQLGGELDKSQRKPTKEFTRDWIDQSMSGAPRSERKNWLSDDSGDSEVAAFLADRGEETGGWLGLDDDPVDDEGLKTATSTKPPSQKIRDLAEKAVDRPKSMNHSPIEGPETSKQSDFWDFGYDPDAVPTTMADQEQLAAVEPAAEAAEATPKPDAAASPTEKPLPPPPGTEKAQPAEPSQASSPPPPPPPKRAPSAKLQRPRKKVYWRGKQCIISLPLNDIRGSAEGGGPLLTTADVEQRMEEWKNDADGQEHPDPMAGGAQSCPAYPDTNEFRQEGEQRDYPVKFPDKAVWDDYVNDLQEQKLRALGVSLGDEEPAPGPMGQDPSSSLPTQSFSPPLPTSSVNSNPMSTTANPFSPAFNQSGQPGSGIGSQTSPSSPFGVLANSPFSNQQLPFSNDQQPIDSGHPFAPHQPTPPLQGGSFTPQNLQGRQGGVSPMNAGALPNLASLLGPVSPLTSEDAQQFPATSTPPQPSHPLANQIQPPLNEEEDEAATQSMQNRGLDIEHDPETILSSSVPEIAQPTPRGHRHNVSETLQKGVERDEYELEDSIRQQLDETSQHQPDNDLMKSRWAVPEDDEFSQQPFHQPDPKSQTEHMQRLFGEQQQNLDNASDIDTNPSLTGASPKPDPNFQINMGSNLATSSHKPTDSATSFGHKSRTSLSGFNADVQTFDPSATFSQNNFSFGGNAFKPASMSGSAFNPSLSHGDSNTAQPSGFNIQTQPFTAGSRNESVSSNSKFKFSASFNVEAPVFNPGGSSMNLDSSTSAAADSGVNKPKDEPKIFGDLDPSQLAQPKAKRSKAIPIVRPDEKKQDSDEKGNQGREKRSRRSGEDDDQQEAVFVSPEQALPTPPVVPSSSVPVEDNKQADDNTSEKSTVPAESIKPQSPSDSQTTPSKLSEPKKEKEAAAAPSNDAHEEPLPNDRGEAERMDTSVLEADQVATPTPNDAATAKELPPEVGKETDSQSNSFALKPTAKSFDFNPAIDVQPLPEPEEPPQPSPPKKEEGLMASRYAVVSPPSSPKSKHASTRSPQQSFQKDKRPLPSDKETSHKSMDENEIDAVMRELNEGESDLGVERRETAAAQDTAMEDDVIHSIPPTPPLRDDRPAPPQREQVHHISTETGKQQWQPILSPQRRAHDSTQSPVRHLNKAEHEHLSDWDEAFSPGADTELRQRSRFFDTHVNEIIGGVLEDRLVPLERTLNVIQHSVGLLAPSGSPTPAANKLREMSAAAKESDADDEDEDDEEAGPPRSRTPLERQERRLDRIKQVVLDALASNEASRTGTPATVDLSSVQSALTELKQLTVTTAEQDQKTELRDAISEIRQLVAQKPEEDQSSELKNSISELKQLVAANPEQDQNNDVKDAITALKHLVIAKSEPDHSGLKDVIAEAISSHPKLNEDRVTTREPVEGDAESLKVQMEGLQSMLRVADDRADDEYKARRRIQDTLAESQRLLKISEEDTGRHREEAEAVKRELQEFKDVKLPEIGRIQEESSSVKEQQESLHLALSELSDKNISLRSALDEHRASRDRSLAELEEAKTENKDLRHTIGTLKEEMENNMQSRQNLRSKFGKLQEDMLAVTDNIAKDQSLWRKKEEEHIAKYNALQSSHEREVKERQKLELHTSDLEQKEKDAMRFKFVIQQSQEENSRLEELLGGLRQESREYQTKAAQLERELHDARENSRLEAQRVRTTLESEVDSANHQTNMIRADLGAQISSLESRLENTQQNSDAATTRHQLLLDEAKESKAATIRDAAEAKNQALQDQRLSHEQTLNDLRERHARALHNASEDKHRDESHYMELLALRDEKSEQLQDKVTYLEERLEIANSAARAAAEAAQTAKNVPSTESPDHVKSPSMSFDKPSGIPEKISPQALRESIMVLQDQLQQREGRIETLEQELSSVDKDAPNKLKEKETEINWLRELLGVRVDDIQDLINVLSQPSFDQNAVRNAAIRLKANLQMQQQEKERALAGGNQPFPSLSSISNLAASASPRALPMAAAAAWGNWRKGRDNSVTSVSSSHPANGSGSDQTPSRQPSKSQGFLSGLMTPPGSNVGQMSANQPAPPPPQRPLNESRPLRSSTGGAGGQRGLTSRHGKSPQTMEPPTTPPLMRQSSYDRDAEAANYEDGSYDDDNESLLGDIGSRESPSDPADGPFGPAI